MFLVEEKDLLLKEFGLLNSNHFCWRKLSQQETQLEPEKTHLLMHKKVVLVGFRRWMKMNYLRLFKGSPKNSVRLIQCPLNFFKIIQKWFFFVRKIVIQITLRELSRSFGNRLRSHHCWRNLALITTLLHLTDPSLICLFCSNSQKGFSQQSNELFK